MGKKFKKDVGAIVKRAGVSFRVWAPFANNVSVTGSFSDWSEIPMSSEDDGYWHVFVKGAQAGQEYKFVIINGDSTYRRNDPRALHYTTNAGNSVIAANLFDWGNVTYKPVPLEQQVLYEMHIGTFNRSDEAIAGTFETAMEKLDHLAELGITTIELMPVSAMSMDHEWWGYTPEYIYAVENLYGGRHQMMEFIKAAHEHGIAVILDVVYNHFGPGSNMDLWQFDGWQQDGKGGIYFYNDWRSSTPWGETRPDYGRTEVQQFLLDNVKMWLFDFKLDGLRADSTLYIRNAKGWNDDPADDLADGWKLLQSINNLAHKINPQALIIAEDMGANGYITKPSTAGGAGFSSQWAVAYPQAFREALLSNKTDKIKLSRLIAELPRRFNDDAFQRVIYSDSHDTAANGSARLNEVIAPGKTDSQFARKQSLLAATILLTTPGIPMLLQGQEFMEKGSFSDWKGLNWQLTKHNGGIIEAYKHLIALRKNNYGHTAGLTGQNINLIHIDDNNKVIAYHRSKKGGPKDDVMVIINFSGQQLDNYELSLPRDGQWLVRFNSSWNGYSPDFKSVDIASLEVKDGKTKMLLPASCALILSQES